jgi:hypothetical protein
MSSQYSLINNDDLITMLEWLPIFSYDVKPSTAMHFDLASCFVYYTVTEKIMLVNDILIDDSPLHMSTHSFNIDRGPAP